MNFEDYKEKVEVLEDSVDRDLEESIELLNDIIEPINRSDILGYKIKCRSIFMQCNRTINRDNFKKVLSNYQCHREDDILYPP